MSELRADTITASDGSSPVTLTKQSAAKAIFNMNMAVPELTSTISGGINSSSLVDNGTGDGTVSLINNMSNSHYICNVDDSGWTSDVYTRSAQVYHNFAADAVPRSGQTSGSTRLVSYYIGNTVSHYDYKNNNSVVFGDLA